MSTPAIVPFWQRLPAFATYPFRGAALASLIAVLICLNTFGRLPGLSGLILLIVCWGAAIKYAFEVLLSTANGRLNAPDVMLGIPTGIVWRFFALVLIMVVVTLLAAFFNPALAIAMAALFTIVYPAAVMTLALTTSLGEALNPGSWSQVISRVGWPYLAIVGLLMVIQVSGGNAAGLLAHVLPAFVADVISHVFTLWSLYATFHLMGYMIYQYHEELGFSPHELAQPIKRPADRDQALLDAAGARVQDGDTVGALALLKEEQNERAVSLEVHELYRRLLRTTRDNAALIEHGRRFLHLLLMEKQDRRALGVARECLDLQPDFTLLQPEDGAHLAQRAQMSGQGQLALDLLRALLRREASHPDAPRWALQIAPLLLRQPNGEVEARGWLQRTQAGCSDSGLRAAIDDELARLPA